MDVLRTHIIHWTGGGGGGRDGDGPSEGFADYLKNDLIDLHQT